MRTAHGHPHILRPAIALMALSHLTLSPALAQETAPGTPPQDPGSRIQTPAQTPNDSAPTHPVGLEGASPELRRHIADQFVRAARRRLYITQDPQPVEYRIAAEMIAGARSLVPPDAELLRLEIEARLAGLQHDRILGLTRQLIAIDPDDEVAQLRLAVETVKRRQTAAGRLEAYEVLLGPQGEGLRKAVRSRLAVDASLLARERGSERLFLEYITYATTLDPSNKEAAALYAAHFLGLSDDPIERADVLTNVVLSDPLDPAALQNLALELVQHGAYRGAFELIRHTTKLYNQRREELPLRLRIELTLAEWNTKGTDHLVDYAQDLEDVLAGRIASEREYAIQQGLDPGPEQEALLPLELEALRLAAAVVKRDEEMQQRMLQKCLSVGENAIPQFLDGTADEATGVRRADALRLTLLWCRAFAGGDLAGMREELAYFSDPNNPNALQPAARRRFEGWLKLHEGDIEGARALLEPLVETDRHARWAMATLEEEFGDEQVALAHYARLAQRFPNTAIGTVAWFRAKDLYDGDLVRSPTAEALSDEAVKLVQWLQGVVPDAGSYMAIGARQIDPPIDPLAGAVLEITIRNRTSWPLALGDNRPIPARVLATPILSFGTSDLIDATRPETFTIPGRLRLNGSEEITFRVRTTRRLVGDVLDVGSVQGSTARWQVTAGFRHDGRRAVPAPFSVSAQTKLASVRSLPAGADPQAIIDAIEGSTDLQRVGAIRAGVLGASALVMQQLDMEEAEIAQRRSVLLNAVAAKFPSLPELERTGAMLSLSMPVARVGGEDMAPVIEALQGERSVYVAAAIGVSGSVNALDNPVISILDGSEQQWAQDLGLHIADTIRMINAKNAQQGG